MTALPDVAAWQASNDAWLGAAVEWLRLLLVHHAPAVAAPQVIAQSAAAPPPSPTPVAEEKSWWTFRRTGAGTTPIPGASAPASAAPRALPPASFEVSKEQVDEAESRMHALENGDPPPAMLLLANRLGLTLFERNVLLLTVAMELDTRIAGLCARAHGDPALTFPTFGLAFQIFDEAQVHWEARSAEGALRYWKVIEAQQSWSQPLTMSALRADEHILDFVKGLTNLDERVSPFVTAVPYANEELPPSQEMVVQQITTEIDRDSRPMQLLGRDSESKQLVAAAAAHRLALTLFRMPAELLPAHPTEVETLARLWSREAMLLRVALLIDAQDVDRAAETLATPLKRFLSRVRGVVFLDAKESWPVPHGSHSVDVEKPMPGEQRELWHRVTNDPEASAELAAQFNLSGATIARVASGAGEDRSFDQLRARAAQQTRMRVDALAQRIDAKATWDDIVLPRADVELLKQIAAHVAGRATVYDDWDFRSRMNRGFGISALFSGESGTGKTMAAEVIANELGLTLHRIDLSSVVSKWVGETEKNLQQLFNAAEGANGILFFDEADALFGKRTDVQQSQDRFANIEISFLLQRLESYRGLAILATNMKGALDSAFLRRLRFIVDFPFPTAELRRRIWEKAFTDKVPMPEEGLDLDRLAKLEITGGSIHNVALASSFLAARAGTPVTMPLVLDAARTELRKLQKPIREADFVWQEKAAS
ncbi:MAG: ATP-binding protein [Thermoanaerobaculia bacterium]